MDKWMKRLGAAALAGSGLLAGAGAQAEDIIKIGVIGAFSAGPYERLARPMKEGILAYVKEHGDHVAGKKIEVIFKDDGGSPEITKRQAQELVGRDHVQFLAGFTLTPNALSTVPVANQSKTPMVVMNAVTNGITLKSPYMTRVAETMYQVTAPLAQWAVKNNIRKVYTLVADYGTGYDAEGLFSKAYKQAGGQIVGSVRVPLNVTEFGPYLQRVKDARPDAVYLFTPNDDQGVAFIKTYAQKQLDKAGIRIIASGDMMTEAVMTRLGDASLGVVTVNFYSEALNTPVNQAFKKAFAAANGKNALANFTAVAGYDGMAVIYETIRKLNGNVDGDKAMQIIRGMKVNSPRSPFVIDPDTHDITQNMYIREVKRIGAKSWNVPIATIPNVKDNGK